MYLKSKQEKHISHKSWLKEIRRSRIRAVWCIFNIVKYGCCSVSTMWAIFPFLRFALV
jgi:hypothetical protein